MYCPPLSDLSPRSVLRFQCLAASQLRLPSLNCLTWWCMKQERYPDLMISVQRLPPKKLLGSLDPALIAMRQKSLDAYLQSVLVSGPAHTRVTTAEYRTFKDAETWVADNPGPDVPPTLNGGLGIALSTKP